MSMSVKSLFSVTLPLSQRPGIIYPAVKDEKLGGVFLVGQVADGQAKLGKFDLYKHFRFVQMDQVKFVNQESGKDVMLVE